MYLTIFTPTYNRAYTLQRLYESLISQTSYDFEWIIVDDASQDNTYEIVKKFKNDKFKVHYYLQKHGGKHRAINYALDQAKGDYFFIVDSDDFLLPTSVENIISWIEKLPNNNEFCGVSGMRIFSSGEIIGSLPDSMLKGCTYIDASNLEREKLGLGGDKAEVYKTSILKTHRFPDFDGEYFITEACVWDAIAAEGYKIRWYKTPIYVCEYLVDGLTKTGANDLDGSITNFKGYIYYVKQYLKLHERVECYRKFIEFNKVCRKKGISIRKRYALVEMPLMLYWQYFIQSMMYRIIKRIGKAE